MTIAQEFCLFIFFKLDILIGALKMAAFILLCKQMYIQSGAKKTQLFQN